MKPEQRKDPMPWTWEIPAGITIAVLLVAAIGIQVARSIANLLAGAGWAWPAPADLFTTIPAILGGHADAGISNLPAVAGAGLLRTVTIIVQLLVLAATFWALWWGMRRFGPGRLQGMATRTDAEKLLGRSRLRKAAPIIRPDLYSRRMK